MSLFEPQNLEILGALIIGFFAGYWLLRWKQRNRAAAVALEEQSILENARRRADSLAREAQLAASEETLKAREQSEKLYAGRRGELTEWEARLNQREALMNRQLEGVVEQERHLRDRENEAASRLEELAAQHKELEKVVRERREKLSDIAHLTETEARAAFLSELEPELMRDAADLTRNIIENSKSKAEEQARRILSVAIQRYAGSHTFETATATVALPGDEIKGRIIGREGRNIRAFESLTGVTVLIDDTPGAVVLSGFDPVRREVAREAMQRLIQDGRIHPTRIEEVVNEVSQELDEAMTRAGEEAVYQSGLPPMSAEVTKVLGSLKFRQSYSQNILAHSVEVAHLTGLIAAELGVDVISAKRAGLLHDIGKALNHELEGSHAIIGAEFVKRHGESEDVVNGVASHHGETPHTGVFGILVSAADAISASRPGARSETMTTYLKRLESLEKIGMSHEGVEKCFAVQAGRELRVIVQPEKISDDFAVVLSRNIARQIEEELQYPGQIRVTVVRETRCVEFAK